MSRRIAAAHRPGPEADRPAPSAPPYPPDPLKLGVQRLGRKWTLFLLRDMAFPKLHRFGQLLRNNPGLTPRVLARRLREMEAEGLIRRSVVDGAVKYELTSHGEDAVFVVLALLRYGSRHFETTALPEPASGG